MHGDAELARVFVQFHAKVSRLLVERMAPVIPTAPKSILSHHVSQIIQKAVGKILPEIYYRLLAPDLFQVFYPRAQSPMKILDCSR